MRVLVSASARYVITPDGVLWTPNPSLGYRFWTRYLDAFDEVRLLVRAEAHSDPPNGWSQASGVGIQACPLPYFVGSVGFMRSYPALRHEIRKALEQTEAVMLRLPCAIGGEVQRMLAPTQPYGVEVVADPYDTFSPNAVKHPLRPLLRWWFTHALRRHCANACAVAYVTEQALQRRYPPAQGAFTTHFSSINLLNPAIAPAPRQSFNPASSAVLIFVGTLDQLYKAPDILIRAVGNCLQRGFNLQLNILGDGRYRSELEQLVVRLGLTRQIRFLGHLSTDSMIREYLDQADLFVLPSRQEGVPRAMIEAMARGLPCIGSIVGGIPELLTAEDMVPPGDVTALANKICEVLEQPQRLLHMSVRNLEKAKTYSDDVLRQRRIMLYNDVRQKTSKWLKQSHHQASVVIY
jgi:glycosyltransferase involved in cell wall biosynthesis